MFKKFKNETLMWIHCSMLSFHFFDELLPFLSVSTEGFLAYINQNTSK